MVIEDISFCIVVPKCHATYLMALNKYSYLLTNYNARHEFTGWIQYNLHSRNMLQWLCFLERLSAPIKRWDRKPITAVRNSTISIKINYSQRVCNLIYNLCYLNVNLFYYMHTGVLYQTMRQWKANKLSRAWVGVELQHSDCNCTSDIHNYF